MILSVPALVVLEQWTKFLAVERLTAVFARATDLSPYEKLSAFYRYRHLQYIARGPYEVLGDYWRMTYAENPGSAFGLFGMWPPHVRFAFFMLVVVTASAFIIRSYRRLRGAHRVRRIALILVLAGAVGNFVDRLARHYVIDFVDWGVGHVRWPTFNLADVFVVVGVGLWGLASRRPIQALRRR